MTLLRQGAGRANYSVQEPVASSRSSPPLLIGTPERGDPLLVHGDVFNEPPPKIGGLLTRSLWG